ncbi:hypothetical protein AOQ84DRAFT_117805 [Glonium stellatum]|uniref:Arb2 domain-containing protein n=1 Tax=Glonium stellatum TaxID=574774 RepID=A0A8E2ET83_9PEZI|nr:hypothetical protein AOQ84DRAFT_117805 [Glonium stellatum]
MFRRKIESLPKDPEFPANLEELGYFITDTGHIRKIENPDESFQFFITNNERFNEVHREAMHKCIRKEVISRMAAQGIPLLYVPQLTAAKPEGSPHIPILATPADILKTRKRVIVLVNDSTQDLGILSYRALSKELGIDGGSVVDFTKEIIRRSIKPTDEQRPDSSASSSSDEKISITNPELHIEAKKSLARHEFEDEYMKRHYSQSTHDGEELTEGTRRSIEIAEELAKIEYKNAPGLIILNPGQTYYSYRYNEAMTIVAWQAQPRKSLLHDPIKIDKDANTVEGNRNSAEHLKFVFQNVIDNPKFVAPDAEIYVIGIESGVADLVKLLNEEWHHYNRAITAMALFQPFVAADEITDPGLASFLRHRARSWIVSPGDTPNIPIATPFSFTPVRSDEAGKGRSHLENKDQSPISPEEMEKPVDWLEEMREENKHLNQPILLSERTQRQVEAIKAKVKAVQGKDVEVVVDNVERTMTVIERVPASSCAVSATSEDGFSPTRRPVSPSPEAHQATSSTSKGKEGESGITNPHSTPGEPNKPQMAPDRSLSADTTESTELHIFNAAERLLCPTFSGGRAPQPECIFADIYELVLDFFEEVARDPFNYSNPEFVVLDAARGDAAPEYPDDPESLNEGIIGDDEERSADTAEGKGKWKQTGTGPKVRFAGSMIDAELVKGAGLATTSAEVENLEDVLGGSEDEGESGTGERV